ncbi:MAG: hypothetical protein QXH80_04095, partial [Candidatus Nanoarchaeia archaeon]
HHCFAYQDPITGIIHSGTIDLSRFTNESIADCYIANSTKQINFKLRLEKAGRVITTQKYYESPSYIISMPVLVIDEDKTSNDVLEISVRKPI